MNYEFKLPDIGEGIHEAELLAWRVSVGDSVRDGQDIVTLNTDKVTVELPSPCSGKVLALHGAPGEVLVVGTVIAVIETNRVIPAMSANQRALEAMHGAIAGPRDEHGANGARIGQSTPQPSAMPGAGASVAKPVLLERVVAGPSTRKLARELEVDLQKVASSGPNGRVLRADVEKAARASASATPDAPEGVRRIRLSGARAISARNMVDSLRQSATTTSTFEVMGDGLQQLRQQLSSEAERRGLKLTPLHFIVKCVAAALRTHERFNATIDPQTSDLLVHERVNLGVAVAAADRLIVPVIRGVDRRLFFDVAREISETGQRAREGKIEVAELRGGTFTLSSTGGIERANMVSTRPIINPPQTATLWVSRISDRPRVIDGQLCAGPVMVCSLSFDHRYVDGAEATYFINDLTDYLEHPERALA
jgi:pyruvate dehydrogenase E2 component (dihydrolipoamide acetyltransferase)